MSNREMGRRYSANVDVSTTPGKSTSLLDIITGNTPSKLQGQRQEWASKFEKEVQELAARIARDKDFRDAAIKGAPPGSFDVNGNQTAAGDEYFNKTALQQVQNMTQQANLASNSLQGPEAQRASDAGVNASLMRNGDKGIPGGFLGPQITPQGSTSGFYDPFNATGITKVTGGTKKQMSTTTGGFTDPTTGITIPGKPLAIEQDVPGGMFPPVNPDVVSETIAKNGAQSQNGISTTPFQGPPAPSVPLPPQSNMQTTPQGMNPLGNFMSGFGRGAFPIPSMLLDPRNKGTAPQYIQNKVNPIEESARKGTSETLQGIMDMIREYVTGQQQQQQ